MQEVYHHQDQRPQGLIPQPPSVCFSSCEIFNEKIDWCLYVSCRYVAGLVLRSYYGYVWIQEYCEYKGDDKLRDTLRHLFVPMKIQKVFVDFKHGLKFWLLHIFRAIVLCE